MAVMSGTWPSWRGRGDPAPLELEGRRWRWWCGRVVRAMLEVKRIQPRLHRVLGQVPGIGAWRRLHELHARYEPLLTAWLGGHREVLDGIRPRWRPSPGPHFSRWRVDAGAGGPPDQGGGGLLEQQPRLACCRTRGPMMGPMRVHLVDGTFELFRAPSRAPAGAPALGPGPQGHGGVVRSLLALLGSRRRGDAPRGGLRQPHHLVPQPALRRLQDRRGWTTLRAQFDHTGGGGGGGAGGDGVADGGVRGRRRPWPPPRCAWRHPGVTQVRILTPDRDLGQVLQGRGGGAGGPHPPAGADRGHPQRDQGLTPAQVPDFLALVGTPPAASPASTAGGESRRRRCLQAHGSLDGIPTRWRPGRRGPRGQPGWRRCWRTGPGPAAPWPPCAPTSPSTPRWSPCAGGARPRLRGLVPGGGHRAPAVPRPQPGPEGAR